MPPEGSGASTRLPAGPAACRRLVSGRLDLEFAIDSGGRTYLRRQYARYPFHVCRALYQDHDRPNLATLYVQSCSGGIYEDDRLDLTLLAGKNAEAHVSTQAATVVHSMPAGSAQQRVCLRCESGSYLEYLPDPQILFPGASLRSHITLKLSESGVAVVSDSILQHDPTADSQKFTAYCSEIVVENDAGLRLAVDRLKIDGSSFAVRCPGVFGSFAAQGTLIVAALNPLSNSLLEKLRAIQLDQEEAVIGASHLPNASGILVRMLAQDGSVLKRSMHMVWCAVRVALKASLPTERRK